MQILYFRHQKFNSAIREPKNRIEKQVPYHPLAQLNHKIDAHGREQKQENIERIQNIGKNNDIILGSWH